MGLNYIIGEIACEELERFNGDDTLYEAIVAADKGMIHFLVNSKYKYNILNKEHTKEPMDIAKMIEVIEARLDRNKRIRLLC